MKRTRASFIALTLSAGLAVAGAGCDRGGGGEDRQENDAVKHDPVVPPPTSAATRPAGRSAGPRVAESAESFLWIREVPPPQWSGNDLIPADVPDLDANWGESTRFPGARLKLTGRGNENLVALLFSNDPKEAIKETWQGDRYYFRMPLRVKDTKALDAATYRLRVSKDTGDETTEGVFLNGDRYHMEPIDLYVTFARKPEHPGMWSIWVGGLYKQRDTMDVSADPRWFVVRGEVYVPE